MADVDIVTELVAACELHHDGVVEIDREDIEVDWARPGYDLATESVGVFDGDRLVAEAEVFKGKRAEINVHPDSLGRGIGTALLGWTEDLAARQGSTRVSQTTTDANTAAAAILEAHGYGYGHTSWILEIEHDARPDDPDLPAGIGFRDYDPERDAHETYRVIEDAFNEWPNRDPATFEDWAALTIERPSFAPWQMILATDERTGDIVGVSFMLDYEAEGGWVQQVATRASHRHQGIARAMLVQRLPGVLGSGRARRGTQHRFTDGRAGDVREGRHARETQLHEPCQGPDLAPRWPRDSNPRGSCPPTRFPGVSLRPLGQATADESSDRALRRSCGR